jgi:hypothetical protein
MTASAAGDRQMFPRQTNKICFDMMNVAVNLRELGVSLCVRVFTTGDRAVGDPAVSKFNSMTALNIDGLTFRCLNFVQAKSIYRPGGMERRSVHKAEFNLFRWISRKNECSSVLAKANVARGTGFANAHLILLRISGEQYCLESL